MDSTTVVRCVVGICRAEVAKIAKRPDIICWIYPEQIRTS